MLKIGQINKYKHHQYVQCMFSDSYETVYNPFIIITTYSRHVFAYVSFVVDADMLHFHILLL